MASKQSVHVGTTTRKEGALSRVGLLLIFTISACTSPIGQGPGVDPTSSNQTAAPSPTLSPSPSPATTAAGFALCAGDATTVKRAALNCLATPPAVEPAYPVSLVFHFDPKLSAYAAQRFRETAEWALPYYYSFFTKLKKPATIHLIVPLSPAWCGRELAFFEYGDPTAETVAYSYLCRQDGGANAGHADSPNTAMVVVRPPEAEVADFKSGKGAAKDSFVYSLIAAEMGHASRSLMMEAYTGELRGQPYWPIWAQYLSNELLWYLGDIRAGVPINTAREDRIWWMCKHEATWKADYGDERLISWESGIGGIYGCPTAARHDDAPNHYNMAFIAGEYLVAKHGFDWLIETFMVVPLETRKGPLIRGLQGAAGRLGYDSWRSIEEELNANMVDVLASYGAALP